MDAMTTDTLLDRAAQLDLSKVDLDGLLTLHRVLTTSEPSEEDVVQLEKLVKDIPEA